MDIIPINLSLDNILNVSPEQIYHPGDHINISLGNITSKFIIKQINNGIIYIYKVTDPGKYNALTYINEKWRVLKAEHINYEIVFVASGQSIQPVQSQKTLYEWPTTSGEVIKPNTGTSEFIRFAREKEANILRVAEKYTRTHILRFKHNIPTRDYPGDDIFEDIPEILVRHIAIYDAPIEGHENMTYYQLLREIWIQYGPILKYIYFFSEHPPSQYICNMSKNVPQVMKSLPKWVQEIYQNTMDKLLGSNELRCFFGSQVCLDTVRENRGFKHIQSADQPPDRDLLDVAREIRQGQHNDRAALAITFDLGNLGDHIMSILHLRDPTVFNNDIYRDFTCQSYIYQTTLMMGEIEDVPSYLERVAALRFITDEVEFNLEYEKLFHAQLSRIPRPDEWVIGPIVRIIHGE